MWSRLRDEEDARKTLLSFSSRPSERRWSGLWTRRRRAIPAAGNQSKAPPPQFFLVRVGSSARWLGGCVPADAFEETRVKKQN